MRLKHLAVISLAALVIGGLIWGVTALNNRVKEPPAPPVDPGVSNPDPTPVPVDATDASPVAFNPEEYDGTWAYDGRDGHHSFFVQVRQPGDIATFAIFCEVECRGINRLAPDDELVSAYVILPNGERYELSFEFIEVPAGGTGDQALDAQLASRGVNLTDGETLPQSKEPIIFDTPLPIGSIIEIETVDTREVNVGAFVQILDNIP